MTIYNLRLSPGNLNGFPSVQYVIRLCHRICRHILLYLLDLAENDGQKQEGLCTQLTALEWNLSAMQQAALDQTGADYAIDVRIVRVCQQATRTVPKYEKVFTLETLNEVPVRVLIQLMARLIADSLMCILPQLPIQQWHKELCRRNLEAVAGLVADICSEQAISRPRFTSVGIQMVVEDQSPMVRFLV